MNADCDCELEVSTRNNYYERRSTFAACFERGGFAIRGADYQSALSAWLCRSLSAATSDKAATLVSFWCAVCVFSVERTLEARREKKNDNPLFIKGQGQRRPDPISAPERYSALAVTSSLPTPPNAVQVTLLPVLLTQCLCDFWIQKRSHRI